MAFPSRLFSSMGFASTEGHQITVHKRTMHVRPGREEKRVVGRMASSGCTCEQDPVLLLWDFPCTPLELPL